ncbi:DUF6159 family protein [Coralloluteibacterium stylophorae]|uniref:Glycerophosphoryl diester phosphodiesterase membrane domain-containing protein n=1 Tax=Coralloluteibacterium stylophorae TaxID=1776034 RepID=A0A8J7VRZ5_9GAMM|nr:DUF6159 family protein [Coralloluteibacterium stylophorae]MBS7458047.1 hypothetical protein [Coralloluteibacterium stylophorae]
MMGKFSRSWALVKASAGVLRSDKELLVFPLIAAGAAALVALSFALPVFGLGLLDGAGRGAPPALYLLAFAFYLSQYFVMFFFNCALVGAAMIRLDGGDPTVRDGLAIAWSRVGAILGYAAVAATVGLLLRALEERLGLVGRIVTGLLGAAWTVATFLTVPVLVARDLGPLDAIRESTQLLRRSWGENLIGNGGIGLAFGLLTVLAGIGLIGGGVVLMASVSTGAGLALIVLGVLATGLLALVQTALSGIYSAALYRFATGAEGGAFDEALLADAFRGR